MVAQSCIKSEIGIPSYLPPGMILRDYQLAGLPSQAHKASCCEGTARSRLV